MSDLTKYGSHVYVLVRRDELRASKIMAKRLTSHPKVTVLWNVSCLFRHPAKGVKELIRIFRLLLLRPRVTVKSSHHLPSRTPRLVRPETSPSTVFSMLSATSPPLPSSSLKSSLTAMDTSRLFPVPHRLLSMVSSPPVTYRTRSTGRLSHLLVPVVLLPLRLKGLSARRRLMTRASRPKMCMSLPSTTWALTRSKKRGQI